MNIQAPVHLRTDAHRMAQEAVDMLTLAWKAFRSQDLGPLEPLGAVGRGLHEREKVVTEAMAAPPSLELPADDPLRVVPMHLERVGDNVELLARAIGTMVVEGTPFTERAMREINTLCERGIELLECVRDVLVTRNRVLVRHVVQAGRGFEEMANDFAFAHQARLIEGVCLPKASSLYLGA